VTEGGAGDFPRMTARIAELEAQRDLMLASMREMVGRMADRGICERAYEAMGEEKPPMRKLKGKPPKYQSGKVENSD
jgi:hypothetical protein